MTNVRNVCLKTRASERPRFIHEKQKNFVLILSNFSGDLCFLFCSNTLILAPECRKYILRGPNFQNFSGGAYPRAPLGSHAFSTSSSFPPTPKILPPAQIPIETLPEKQLFENSCVKRNCDIYLLQGILEWAILPLLCSLVKRNVVLCSTTLVGIHISVLNSMFFTFSFPSMVLRA